MNRSLALFLRSNRRHLAEMMGASVLVNLFLLAMPLFSMLVYDKAMGNQVHDTLWALSIGMLLLLAQELLLRMARVQMVEHAGARWDSHLDERLMRGVLAAPLSKPIAAADLVSKYRELGATRDVLSAQGLLPLADLPFMLIFVLVLVVIGGPLAWVPVGAGAALLGISSLCQAMSVDRLRLAHVAHRAKLSTLFDVLAARESLVGQPMALAAAAHFNTQAQTGARAAARARWWGQINQQAVPVLMSLTSVLVLVLGVFRVEAQEMSVGGLISVNMISGRLMAVLCGAAPVLARWKEFKRALASLGASVDLAAPPAESTHEAATALQAEGIRLDGLAFNYPDQERKVLDGLNLHLRSGELVVLVGNSGAGKSTLLRLLAGQMSASAGRLVFGGHLVNNDASRHWLNHQVVHKTQDPSFLGGSLRDIVCGGAAGALDVPVTAALRAAGLGPALDHGELGLNSPVGTNGQGLSGGQRQMLALAAAFYSNRPLLLLDEPTLGLDRAAQESVLLALKPLAEGRCVVVASHATEVIARADRVLVIDQGRIVADAPPAQLLGTVAAAARSVPTVPVSAAGGAPAQTKHAAFRQD